MRISDWSSDVCSSDLTLVSAARTRSGQAGLRTPNSECRFAYPSKIELFFLLGLEASGAYLASSSSPRFVPPGADNRNKRNASPDEVGGALAGHSKARWQAWELDRKSVVEGKRVSVRLELGGRRF